MKSKTNWDKLLNITDKEIEKAAKSDPDVSILTNDEFKQFKRVNPVEVINVKNVRNALHLSQEKFAGFFGVSKRTIQEWEQGRRTPNTTSRNFLRVVQYAPDVVQAALKEENKLQPRRVRYSGH